MCCHCIEEYILAFIPGTIFFEENSTDLIETLPDGYLQESSDLNIAINFIKKSEYFSTTNKIFLCKIFEFFIENEFDINIYELYLQNYEIKDNSRKIQDSDFINYFHNISNFKSATLWKKFVNRKNTEINSESILAHYSEWWIDELEDKMHDQDMLNEAIKEKLEEFELIFPAVFFSLCLSIKKNTNQKLIEKIAIKCPGCGQNNHLACNDLWLQRKALTACVMMQGYQFILSNIDKITENHIHYILAKFELRTENIQFIKDIHTKYSSNISNPDRISKILLDNFDRLLSIHT